MGCVNVQVIQKGLMIVTPLRLRRPDTALHDNRRPCPAYPMTVGCMTVVSRPSEARYRASFVTPPGYHERTT